MKQYFGTLLLLLATLPFLFAQKQAADQDGIRTVLDAETRAFFARDHDKWASYNVQDSTFRMLFAGPGYYYNIVGWDSMDRWRDPAFKAPPVTGETLAAYLNKFDYRYQINGNTAFVSFREGTSEKTATDQTRLLVKQNGAWKVAGGSIVAAPAYALQRMMRELQLAAGKWRMDVRNKEDSASGVINRTFVTDVHETTNGLEMVTHKTLTRREGTHYAVVETEQFIPDMVSGEIKYITITKYLNGDTQVLSGKVEKRENGTLVAVMMHPDAPALKEGEMEISLLADGRLQFKNSRFDKAGNRTGGSLFVMRRM